MNHLFVSHVLPTYSYFYSDYLVTPLIIFPLLFGSRPVIYICIFPNVTATIHFLQLLYLSADPVILFRAVQTNL